MVITKLDGTSKGGMVVAIQNELKLPVKFVGLGEKPEDLQKFVPALQKKDVRRGPAGVRAQGTYHFNF